MSKTEKNEPERRSWLAQSAYRSGAGPHRDRRDRRKGTRAQQREREVNRSNHGGDQ
jgi:hypothetical protein